MFLHLSVILFTAGGGGLPHTHPKSPRADNPWANTPWADIPQTDTLLGKHPLGRHPPGRHPLCSAFWNTVNKRAVRILLECILVLFSFTRLKKLFCLLPNNSTESLNFQQTSMWMLHRLFSVTPHSTNPFAVCDEYFYMQGKWKNHLPESSFFHTVVIFANINNWYVEGFRGRW